MKVAAVVALLLVACSSSITTGEVTDKEFRPAYDSTWMMPIRSGEVCTGTGTSNSPRVCTPLYTYIPMTTHHPDAWFVTIEGRPRYDAGLEHRQIEVSKPIFDSLVVGDAYTVPSPKP